MDRDLTTTQAAVKLKAHDEMRAASLYMENAAGSDRGGVLADHLGVDHGVRGDVRLHAEAAEWTLQAGCEGDFDVIWTSISTRRVYDREDEKGVGEAQGRARTEYGRILAHVDRGGRRRSG